MNKLPDNLDAVTALHESLGNEYRAAMRVFGVRRAPPVGWMTPLHDVNEETRACIFWDDGSEEEVFGFARDVLVREIIRRVLARLGSGN